MHAETIYSAAIDDDLFRQLPMLLAQQMKARSAVLHWHDPSGTWGELADNGYFKPEHMLAYDANFSNLDIWSQAVGASAVANRPWRLDDLVPASAYEQSRIYNDWIRAMGDDTFYAAGAVLLDSWGRAEVGLHRGRADEPFSDLVLHTLESDLKHLRLMLGIRAKLSASERNSRTRSQTLDLIPMGVLGVGRSGNVTYTNAAADQILRKGRGLRLSAGNLRVQLYADQVKLDAAIASANRPDKPRGGAIALRGERAVEYLLSIAPLAVGGMERQAVIFITTSTSDEVATAPILRQLFDLTEGEAFLASRLAGGASLQEIAQRKGVSVSTLRTQLKAVSQKLGCRRQAEIVALVRSVPGLQTPPS